MLKPLAALILGPFMKDFPRGVVFGHAGAVIGRTEDSPSEQLRRVSRTPEHSLPRRIEDALRLLQAQLGVEVRA